METKMIRAVLAAICVATVSLASRADSLVVPAHVTAQSWYTSGDYDWRTPVSTINGSGMSAMQVTEDSTATTLYQRGMWMSNRTKETWIMFDMGEEMTLTGFRVWNYNEPNFTTRGIQTCEVRYGGSTMLANGDAYSDACAWGVSAGTFTFARASGRNGQEGEDFAFDAQITTRYVLLRVLNNYGDGSNFAGLSEVRFYARNVQRWSQSGSSSSSAFNVKSDDLLQTVVASVDGALVLYESNNAYTTNEIYQTSDVSRLADGAFGPVGSIGGLCIKGGTVTYNLDVSSAVSGYDVSEVRVYAGWNTSGGHENPSVTLFCRKVGESVFRPVGTGYYACTTTGTTNNRHACLKIVNLGLKGVAALRFDFGGGEGQQNRFVCYKEIDVIRDRCVMFAPSAATSENYFNKRGPVNTINWSGMSGTTAADGVVVEGATANTTADNATWLSDNNLRATWIAFDMGTVRRIKGFHLWNYNENTSASQRGIKTAEIYKGDSMPAQGMAYTNAGAAWGTLVQSMTFYQAPGTSGDPGRDYYFNEPVTTRYLQFYITATHDTGTNGRRGVAEIVFYGDDEATVTRRDSGTKTLPDAMDATVTVIEGTGTAAPVTLDQVTTRIDTLRTETYDGPAQIDANGKTLALSSIDAPAGTAGIEILQGGTLTSVTGKRNNTMKWSIDSVLTIHGNVSDSAAGAVSFEKTGSGKVVFDGDISNQGGIVFDGGCFHQTGGSVNTKGWTYKNAVCEFAGGVSRETSAATFSVADASLSGGHVAEWASLDLANGGTSSLVITDGATFKTGGFTGGTGDFPMFINGGTLGTSTMATVTPWMPAVGVVAVGANGASFDTSAGSGTMEVAITNATAGAIRKTGTNTLTMKGRVVGASPVSVEGGTLALSLPAAIVHYDFENISGTTVPNLGTGGSALNGVMTGAPEQVEGVNGGTALKFAANKGVATAGSVTLRQYTFSAWVKHDGANNAAQRIMIGGRHDSYDAAGFLGYMGMNTNFRIWATIGSDNESMTVEPGVDMENWHHIASTYDGNTLAFYVDGVLVQTKAVTPGRIAATVKIGFGNNVTPNAEYWNGAMDEAYVFDRALSADEVAALKENSWQAVNVLDPGTELRIAADATLDLGGIDQTVATFSVGDHLYCYGETTWGAVGSGAAHETPRITGTGILRVKGPARRGMVIIIK